MNHLTEPQIAELRADLERQLARLQRSMALSDEAVKTVELDQTAVGRLSRMDSLLSQGMAKGLQEREAARLTQVVHALQRIERGSYGICDSCRGEIAFGRLLVFPEAESCGGCG